MAQTPEQYYNDEDQYGSGQYVSFTDILDGMLAEIMLDDDHILKNIKRAALMRFLKNAIRDIHPKAGNEIVSIEFTVPDNYTMPFPQDYLNYLAVYRSDMIQGGYKIFPLDINYHANVAEGFLQDNTGGILFDDDGYILTADSTNVYASPYRRWDYCRGYQPRLDTSRLSKYGEVIIDTKRNIFSFSSDLAEKEIVLDYISDGLKADEGSIKVHKFLRRAVEEMAYFFAVERKLNVGQNEKERAKRAYKTSLHTAKIQMADFDMSRIARVMRINTITP